MNLLIQEVIPYDLMHGSYGEMTLPSVWFSWRTFLILRKASVGFCVGGACAVDFCFTGIQVFWYIWWQAGSSIIIMICEFQIMNLMLEPNSQHLSLFSIGWLCSILLSTYLWIREVIGFWVYSIIFIFIIHMTVSIINCSILTLYVVSAHIA